MVCHPWEITSSDWLPTHHLTNQEKVIVCRYTSGYSETEKVKLSEYTWEHLVVFYVRIGAGNAILFALGAF